MIISLIIDYGVESWGHWWNIFSKLSSASVGVCDFSDSNIIGVFDLHSNFVPSEIYWVPESLRIPLPRPEVPKSYRKTEVEETKIVPEE